MIYQVPSWDEFFENAKSRTYDECSFVCMPNKQHGLGFKRIWSQPDGPALFGCWCALIQTLSRQRKPRRGYLTDTGRAPAGYCADGDVPGTILTADDLAFMWGCPVELVQRMFEVCSGPKVGWLKALPDQIPEGYRKDTDRIPQSPERKKEEKEEKGKGDGTTPPIGKPSNARDALTKHLRKLALPATEQTTQEWADLCSGRAGCSCAADGLAFVSWAVKRGLKDGTNVQYPRQAALYADEWARKGAA